MQAKNFLLASFIAVACISISVSAPALAETKQAVKTAKARTYKEMEFLRGFSGKTRQQVSDVLGQPARREQSVKPSGAEYTMGRPVDTSTPVHVEMWYYKNVVEYDKKKTYKTTELTFVNDHCANIAFFNN